MKPQAFGVSRIAPKVLLPGGRVKVEVKEVVAPKVLLP